MRWCCAFVVVMTISVNAFASTCLVWEGLFPEVMLKRDLVVRVEVEAFGEKLEHGETLHESMTVKVKEVLKGRTDLGKIEVLGDNGRLPREYIDTRKFKIGQEYLLALSTPERGVAPLGGCGEHSVSIVKNEIVGTDRDMKGNPLQYTRSMKSVRETLEEAKEQHTNSDR